MSDPTYPHSNAPSSGIDLHHSLQEATQRAAGCGMSVESIFDALINFAARMFVQDHPCREQIATELITELRATRKRVCNRWRDGRPTAPADSKLPKAFVDPADVLKFLEDSIEKTRIDIAAREQAAETWESNVGWDDIPGASISSQERQLFARRERAILAKERYRLSMLKHLHEIACAANDKSP